MFIDYDTYGHMVRPHNIFLRVNNFYRQKYGWWYMWRDTYGDSDIEDWTIVYLLLNWKKANEVTEMN